MPGRIVKVLVARGETVRARQGLVVMEAMKMENELRAARDGVVSEVHVAEGQLVDANTLLAVIASV
jgi:biotin carboxyl carrier protein